MNKKIGFCLGLLLSGTTAFSAVTYEEYEAVLKKTHEVLKSDVAKLGLKLVVNDIWEDSVKNAYAKKIGNRLIVNILGGIAINQYTTKDSLALIACGTVGNYLGGHPLRPTFEDSKISAPAQADYYATSKCLKKFFLHDDNAREIEGKAIPAIAQRLCSFVYPDENEKSLCIRSAIAAQELAFILKTSDRVANLETPSREAVSETNLNNYPSQQCRLDTFFAGALCNSESADGYCHGDNLGSRPLCWFKPVDDGKEL